MSRVHCLECGAQVVLDPRGVCPEGHHVGASGARVEQAMGNEMAHPDEPEPWVYNIDPSELTSVGAHANGTATHGHRQNGTGPREARPVHVPSFGDEASASSGAESLLRELHSLAALDQHHAGGDAPSAPVNGVGAREQRTLEDAQPGGPPPPPTGTSPNPARAPRPDPDAIAEAFAELSALDAPAQAMTSRSSANGRAHRNDRTATGSRPGTPEPQDQFDHDELASLFNTPPAPAATAARDSHVLEYHAPHDQGHHDQRPHDDDTRDHLASDHGSHDDLPAAGPRTSDAPAPRHPAHGSAPKGNAPGGSTPNGSTPAGSTPKGSAPVGGTPDDGVTGQDGPDVVPAPPTDLPPVPPAHDADATADRFQVDPTELAFELTFGDEGPASTPQPDFAEGRDDLPTGDGLFEEVGTGDAAATRPLATTPGPAVDPAPTPDTAAAPSAAAHHASTPSAPDAASDPVESPTRSPAPDLTSFTAKGGSAGRGGRRRRFGR